MVLIAILAWLLSSAMGTASQDATGTASLHTMVRRSGPVADLSVSRSFYAAALAPLDAAVVELDDGEVAFGPRGSEDFVIKPGGPVGAAWVQQVSVINPVHHFVTISRAILMNGAGVAEIAQPFLILGGTAAIVLFVAVRQYCKQAA